MEVIPTLPPLPPDLLRRVFGLIDAADVAKCSLVCPAWNSLAKETWPSRILQRWRYWSDPDKVKGRLDGKLYGERYKIDKAAIKLLNDMQWPARRCEAAQQLRTHGADVLDILMYAPCVRGSCTMGMRYWAHQALIQVKTQLSVDMIHTSCSLTTEGLESQATRQAIEKGATCIAAVHCPYQDVHEDVDAALEQLAGAARRRLFKAAMDKASRCATMTPTTSLVSGSSGEHTCHTGTQEHNDAMHDHDRHIHENVGVRPGSCDGNMFELTAQEALDVLNQLLFGQRDPSVLPSPSTIPTSTPISPGMTPGPSLSSPHSHQLYTEDDLHLVPQAPAPRFELPPDQYGLGLEGNSQEFYSPGNSVISHVLASRQGIPITLAVIHMAVAQRLGLPVHMVNMPMRVINRMPAGQDPTILRLTPDPNSPPTTSPPSSLRAEARHSGSTSTAGAGAAASATTSMTASVHILPPAEDLYIDVFQGGLIMDQHRLKSLMQALGVVNAAPERLNPLNPKGVVMRMCANLIDIYKAYQDVGKVHMMLQLATAALPKAEDVWVMRMRAALSISDFGDAYLCLKVIQDDIFHPLPMALSQRHLSELHQDIQDIHRRHMDACAVVKRRHGPQAAAVKFHVGHVIRHNMFFYTGVVQDWDTECANDDGWMDQNGVDALPGGGRQQPFYLVAEERPLQRSLHAYCAQCHLRPSARADPATIQELISSDLGKHFIHFDADKHWFVPNAHLRYRFPDDETAGQGVQRWALKKEAELANFLLSNLSAMAATTTGPTVQFVRRA